MPLLILVLVHGSGLVARKVSIPGVLVSDGWARISLGALRRCRLPYAAKRLVNDAADGGCALAAPCFATETGIDLAYRVHPLRLDDGADALIAQQIARADDHNAKAFFSSDWP